MNKNEDPKTKKTKTQSAAKEPKSKYFKFFDKGELVESILNERDVDFYIRRSTKNINISLVIVSIALLFAILKIFAVGLYADKSVYHISGVDGRVYQLDWSREKQQETFDAIVEIREKQMEDRD